MILGRFSGSIDMEEGKSSGVGGGGGNNNNGSNGSSNGNSNNSYAGGSGRQMRTGGQLKTTTNVKLDAVPERFDEDRFNEYESEGEHPHENESGIFTSSNNNINRNNSNNRTNQGAFVPSNPEQVSHLDEVNLTALFFFKIYKHSFYCFFVHFAIAGHSVHNSDGRRAVDNSRGQRCA